MAKVDQRKYLLAQINASQYQTAYLKEKLEELDGKGAGAEEETDVAETAANSKAAKQAAERTAAAKGKGKSLAREEDAGGEDDGLGFLDGDAEEDAGPTEDDVKTAVKKFAAAFGKDKVAKLLEKFKAKAMQDIKPAKYQELIDMVNTALKKHKK